MAYGDSTVLEHSTHNPMIKTLKLLVDIVASLEQSDINTWQILFKIKGLNPDMSY
jgi:hypothetical protein